MLLRLIVVTQLRDGKKLVRLRELDFPTVADSTGLLVRSAGKLASCFADRTSFLDVGQRVNG